MTRTSVARRAWPKNTFYFESATNCGDHGRQLMKAVQTCYAPSGRFALLRERNAGWLSSEGPEYEAMILLLQVKGVRDRRDVSSSELQTALE